MVNVTFDFIKKAIQANGSNACGGSNACSTSSVTSG
jgi:hypothetical protein